MINTGVPVLQVYGNGFRERRDGCGWEYSHPLQSSNPCLYWHNVGLKAEAGLVVIIFCFIQFPPHPPIFVRFDAQLLVPTMVKGGNQGQSTGVCRLSCDMEEDIVTHFIDSDIGNESF